MLERHLSAYSQHSLFKSSPSYDRLPIEHRSSVSNVSQGLQDAIDGSLTKALLESHPEEFKQATETNFLRLAGSGRVSKSTLSKWLSQDRLYAESYICFLSSLLARVTLPYAFVSDKSRSLRWRIVNLLTGALENIQREINFFTSVADKHGLELDRSSDEDENVFMPEEATTQYIDLFRSFHNDNTLPLIEGLVVLWATEKCYLEAWRYASKFTLDASSESPASDADGGALRTDFIPNWTNEEFAKFVDEIAEVTDMLAERENAGRKLAVYKAVWLHVLDIEKRFWPDVDDDDGRSS